jgi:hypothetical protein
MGRSVSFAAGSVAITYRDVTHMGYVEKDDDSGEEVYDEFIAQMHYKDFIDNLRETCKSIWPSFVHCDEWLGSEDKAILQNDHAYVGVSEYCGLASVWLVPKEENNLAARWCSQIKNKFEDLLGDLHKVGHFSNGTGVYTRKELSSCVK